LTIIFSCQSHQDTKIVLSDRLQTSKSSYLPDFVENYLTKELSGWKLVPKNSWNDSVINKYNNDSLQINYVLADINCDNKTDFTGILKDSAGNFAAFQIYSFEQYYLSCKLDSLSNKTPLDVGLRLLNNKTPFDDYDGSKETFKCGAIEIFNVHNKAKKVFYSNEKGSYIIEVGK
jgi:hypothetical protein